MFSEPDAAIGFAAYVLGSEVCIGDRNGTSPFDMTLAIPMRFRTAALFEMVSVPFNVVDCDKAFNHDRPGRMIGELVGDLARDQVHALENHRAVFRGETCSNSDSSMADGRALTVKINQASRSRVANELKG